MKMKMVMAALAAAVMAAGAAENRTMTFAEGSRVRINDAFWAPRFDTWRNRTIDDVLMKFDRESHAFENFDMAAKGGRGGHRGAPFFDGLVYETIRGISDYLAREPSKDLEARLDAIIDRIVAAQRPDGYLHTMVQLGGGTKRWGDNGGCSLEQHEIYDAGALIEAGVHYYRATGKTQLLVAGIRFANLMCDTMGPRPKRNLIPTHSIAEEAMVKLARLVREEPGLAAKCTGVRVRSAEEYLALVRFWFDSHGDNCGLPEWQSLIDSENLGGCGKVIGEMRRLSKEPHDASWRPSLWDYQMDAKPLREYESIEGHAVRAALLVCGLAAYARETGDAESLELAKRFWDSMTGRKMYISGGVGAKADLERFAADFELPPDAYLETCAAVASAFTSGVLAEITGDGKYMDEFERVVYNALLTAVGENGCSYTYQNPLNTEKGSRWNWHGCPCCPPMFLKLTGALPGYIYSADREGVRINLFVGGGAELEVNGLRIALSQATRYPEDGKVEISVAPEKKAKFALKVRVPGWARGVESWSGLYASDGKREWTLQVNGENVTPELVDGYAVIEREWAKDDRVTLTMDVSPRRIVADSRVEAVKGMHAIACGPVLMAEENGRRMPYYQVANKGPAPHRVWIADPVTVTVDPSKVRTKVSPDIYGTGMEDVNHEIYGGLDAQQLFGESFEESPRNETGLSGAWHIAANPKGTQFVYANSMGDVCWGARTGSGAQYMYSDKGARIGMYNMGLHDRGIAVRKGAAMPGYVWAFGPSNACLSAALESADGKITYAKCNFRTSAGWEWRKYDFSLVPGADDAKARFTIYLESQANMLFDDVYLSSPQEGRFAGLGVRCDVAEGLAKTGVNFIRWGGTMANAPEYLLENMRPGERTPYRGFWYREASGGFGPYEFVGLAERMKLPCAFSINMREKTDEAVKLAKWLKERALPRQVYVQIGNEECIVRDDAADYMRYAENFLRLEGAMRAVNPALKFVSAAWWRKGSKNMDIVFDRIIGHADYQDLHPWTNDPKVTLEQRRMIAEFREYITNRYPKATLRAAVFEENGCTHGMDRALSHALMTEAVREAGDFILTSCQANAFQPDGCNDNGWDQGLVFLSSDKVWLQPQAYANRMAAEFHRELLVEGRTDCEEVSVSATRDEQGKSVVLHLVNVSATEKPMKLEVPGYRIVKAVSLSATALEADNPERDPERISPRDITARMTGGSVLQPYSYTVIELSR